MQTATLDISDEPLTLLCYRAYLDTSDFISTAHQHCPNKWKWKKPSIHTGNLGISNIVTVVALFYYRSENMAS